MKRNRANDSEHFARESRSPPGSPFKAPFHFVVGGFTLFIPPLDLLLNCTSLLLLPTEKIVFVLKGKWIHTLDQLRSGQLAGVKHLKISSGLISFPLEIYDLSDSLEILDLSGNDLTALPDDFTKLNNLRILFVSNNQFIELPEILGKCQNLTMIGFKSNRISHVSGAALPPYLRWLILTDNQIETLPVELGQCQFLQKLMLAGNRLQTLPASLANCSSLELLRISANQLTYLPTWLFNMPRLSWLAFAGNKFTSGLEAAALEKSKVADIPWNTISIHEKLGEGASGYIHHAQSDFMSNENQSIALKVFKGAVTSDGFPRSEMAAWISARVHPNLIHVLGKIIGHPEATFALLMPLVGDEYSVLAAPPSFESCTRDLYLPEISFSPSIALSIAYGIASAAVHLHSQGIVHGDLYAHNILVSPEGETIMGDFGAASLYEACEAALSARLQRLEVRAFGCLLEELADRIDKHLLPSNVQEQLTNLVTACLQPIPAHRPLFAEIEKTLSRLVLLLKGCHQSTPYGNA